MSDLAGADAPPGLQRPGAYVVVCDAVHSLVRGEAHTPEDAVDKATPSDFDLGPGERADLAMVVDDVVEKIRERVADLDEEPPKGWSL